MVVDLFHAALEDADINYVHHELRNSKIIKMIIDEKVRLLTNKKTNKQRKQ